MRDGRHLDPTTIRIRLEDRAWDRMVNRTSRKMNAVVVVTELVADLSSMAVRTDTVDIMVITMNVGVKTFASEQLRRCPMVTALWQAIVQIWYRAVTLTSRNRVVSRVTLLNSRTNLARSPCSLVTKLSVGWQTGPPLLRWHLVRHLGAAHRCVVALFSPTQSPARLAVLRSLVLNGATLVLAVMRTIGLAALVGRSRLLSYANKGADGRQAVNLTPLALTNAARTPSP